MNLPQRPQTQNAYQIAGQLFGQGGQLVDQYSQQQQAQEESKLKLSALMQDMAQKRAAAEMAKIKADFEMKAEQEKQQRAAAAAEFAKGEVVSPTLAGNQSLARSSRPLVPGGPTQAEVDGLTLAGDQMPTQAIGASDPMSLMNAALDKMNGASNPGRIPRKREEIMQNLVENQMFDEMGKYAAATRPMVEGLSLDDRMALIDAQARANAGKPLNEYQERSLALAEGRLRSSQASREQSQMDRAFNQEQKLQDKFLGQTKDFRDVRDAYGRIQVSAKDPSPAGDLALIFNYMKMLDPGSTVREGEFATAAASGSYGDRFQAAAGKILSGERLSQDQRDDFLNRSRALYSQQAAQARKTESETKKQARQYNLNESRATTDIGLSSEPTLSRAIDNSVNGIKPVYAPPIGTIKGGYMFKGGNPNDKNNWVKK